MSLLDHLQERPIESNPGKYFYRNDEIVQCLVLEQVVPAIAKQRYEELLENNPNYKINVKSLGLAFKVAIIGRNVDYSIRSVDYHIYSKDKIVVPKMQFTTTIEMPSPLDILSDPYGYVHTYGVSSKLYNGNPNRAVIMPNPSKNVSYLKNKAEIERELTKRKLEWEKLIEEYDNSNNDEVLQFLNYKLAQKHGLGRIEGDSIEFVKIEPGVSFYSAVHVNDKGTYKFIKLSPFSSDSKNKSVISPIDAKYSLNNTFIVEELLELINKIKSKNNNKLTSTISEIDVEDNNEDNNNEDDNVPF